MDENNSLSLGAQVCNECTCLALKYWMTHDLWEDLNWLKLNLLFPCQVKAFPQPQNRQYTTRTFFIFLEISGFCYCHCFSHKWKVLCSFWNCSAAIKELCELMKLLKMPHLSEPSSTPWDKQCFRPSEGQFIRHMATFRPTHPTLLNWAQDNKGWQR